ncbi:MAG: hypothetical protein KDD39_12255, partial [Bdellovibrionales bacterium]|nr:hypothetical protein [Bdellovibrionales bacterium]
SAYQECLTNHDASDTEVSDWLSAGRWSADKLKWAICTSPEALSQENLYSKAQKAYALCHESAPRPQLRGGFASVARDADSVSRRRKLPPIHIQAYICSMFDVDLNLPSIREKAVRRAFKVCLTDHEAEQGDVNGWLKTGGNWEKLWNGICQSEEARAPENVANKIELAYSKCYGREPSRAEFDFWREKSREGRDPSWIQTGICARAFK